MRNVPGVPACMRVTICRGYKLSVLFALATFMDLHNDIMAKKVVIREYDGDRDLEAVEKLERSCEVRSRRGFSILTNMMGDPICRIRLYPTHIMLVAELAGNQEVVGVVRGCMKTVGTGLGPGHVKLGCILGLRVSPNHRRMGIGSKLVKSVESWAMRNGAQYLSLATEEKNVASINLFVLKFDYIKLASLRILIQPINKHARKSPSQSVKIEKLTVEQAISVYKDRLGGGKLFPLDIEAILKEKLSVGTWVSYFKHEKWAGLHCREKNDELLKKTPSSWAILSMWKTYESYNLQVRGPPLFRCFHATLSHMGSKILPCLRIHTSSELLSGPFGFLFLYGLHGEGERNGDLMKPLWCFANNLARNIKDCKVMVTELGACDPLRKHIPWGSFTSRIDDLWFLKRVENGGMNDIAQWASEQASSYVFVDPRDF